MHSIPGSSRLHIRTPRILGTLWSASAIGISVSVRIDLAPGVRRATDLAHRTSRTRGLDASAPEEPLVKVPALVHAAGQPEVVVEREEVERVPEGNHPFDDRTDIRGRVQRDREDDGEDDEDEGDESLGDVCDAQLALAVVVFVDPAILYDGEDSAEPDTDDEDKQEDAMQTMVSPCVEDGEEDEACAADERADHGQCGEYFLATTHVRVQPAPTISKPQMGICTLRTHLPECLSHLSTTSVRKKDTPVMQQHAIKSGLR